MFILSKFIHMFIYVWTSFFFQCSPVTWSQCENSIFSFRFFSSLFLCYSPVCIHTLVMKPTGSNLSSCDYLNGVSVFFIILYKSVFCLFVCFFLSFLYFTIIVHSTSIVSTAFVNCFFSSFSFWFCIIRQTIGIGFILSLCVSHYDITYCFPFVFFFEITHSFAFSFCSFFFSLTFACYSYSQSIQSVGRCFFNQERRAMISNEYQNYSLSRLTWMFYTCIFNSAHREKQKKAR